MSISAEEVEGRSRILALFVFSLAFSFVEAAVVIYLHQFLPAWDVRAGLRDPNDLFADKSILGIEMLREIATVFMLGSVAYLWGNNLRERILAFVFAFSVWDLGYYFFLNRYLGWPKDLFDIDIYFLVPFPWVGPVILPVVLFSVLFAVSFWFLAKQKE